MTDRERITELEARLEQRDKQIAVYNSGGFADADALAEKFLDLQDRIAALEMEREALKMWIRELVTFAPHRGEKVQQLLSHPPKYWAEKAKEWR